VKWSLHAKTSVIKTSGAFSSHEDYYVMSCHMSRQGRALHQTETSGDMTRCEHPPQRRLAQVAQSFELIYRTTAIWLRDQTFIRRLAFMVHVRENHPFGGPVHPGFLDQGPLTANLGFISPRFDARHPPPCTVEALGVRGPLTPCGWRRVDYNTECAL